MTGEALKGGGMNLIRQSGFVVAVELLSTQLEKVWGSKHVLKHRNMNSGNFRSDRKFSKLPKITLHFWKKNKQNCCLYNTRRIITLPETMRELRLSTKFQHHKIRWKITVFFAVKSIQNETCQVITLRKKVNTILLSPSNLIN